MRAVGIADLMVSKIDVIFCSHGTNIIARATTTRKQTDKMKTSCNRSLKETSKAEVENLKNGLLYDDPKKSLSG